MTNKLPLLIYPTSPTFLAFTTLREGGVSQGEYASFNLNPYCGDNLNDVRENAQRLATALKIPADRIFLPYQTHQTSAALVDEAFLALTTEMQLQQLHGVDIIIANTSNVCVGVSTADCIPILLYHPHLSLVCAVHAGWRGTVARIVQKAVDKLNELVPNCAPHLHAIIGPGISLAHFEVGDEVYDAFVNAGFDGKKIARKEDKWHINLTLCNQQQLLQKGLLSENIHVDGRCTYQEDHTFFSARRQGIHSGRLYTGIIHYQS